MFDLIFKCSSLIILNVSEWHSCTISLQRSVVQLWWLSFQVQLQINTLHGRTWFLQLPELVWWYSMVSTGKNCRGNGKGYREWIPMSDSNHKFSGLSNRVGRHPSNVFTFKENGGTCGNISSVISPLKATNLEIFFTHSVMQIRLRDVSELFRKDQRNYDWGDLHWNHGNSQNQCFMYLMLVCNFVFEWNQNSWNI